MLSLPLLDKLQQLEILFERCTVRQIQEIFPVIVHSIFGINGNPLGWGLRTTTMENASHYFNRLQHFLGVNGIWMHICHRLLNETTKFEIEINLLPVSITFKPYYPTYLLYVFVHSANSSACCRQVPCFMQI